LPHNAVGSEIVRARELFLTVHQKWYIVRARVFEFVEAIRTGNQFVIMSLTTLQLKYKANETWLQRSPVITAPILEYSQRLADNG
jgi:hypothetical protein